VSNLMEEARARRAKIVNAVLGKLRARPLHQAADAQLVADRAHNEAVVAAYRETTADVPAAERLAAARGEAATEAAAEAADRKRRARPEKTTAALADLVTPAAAPAATEDDDYTPAPGLGDLLG
jgi:hypothetical protein